jgi:hypothetical protein
MRFRIFLSIYAILLIIFGFGFLFAPAWMFNLYGASTNDLGLLTARAFAVWNIWVGVVVWVAKDDFHSKLFSVMITTLFLSNLAFTLIATLGQIVGTLNTLGWLNVILYLLFALGFAYLLFTKPYKVERIVGRS